MLSSSRSPADGWGQSLSREVATCAIAAFLPEGSSVQHVNTEIFRGCFEIGQRSVQDASGGKRLLPTNVPGGRACVSEKRLVKSQGKNGRSGQCSAGHDHGRSGGTGSTYTCMKREAVIFGSDKYMMLIEMQTGQ